jgi:hypothetical protein
MDCTGISQRTTQFYTNNRGLKIIIRHNLNGPKHGASHETPLLTNCEHAKMAYTALANTPYLRACQSIISGS